MIRKLLLTAFICLSALWGIAQTSITGTVFNDGNNNGVKDTNDVGYPFVVVNAYAPGATIPTATATTLATPAASTGNYTLSGLTTGVKYRLEFLNPNNYYNGAFATGSKSSVQFATPGSTNVNFGFRFAGVCIVDQNTRYIGGANYAVHADNCIIDFTYADKQTFSPLTLNTVVGQSFGFVPQSMSAKKSTKKVFFTGITSNSYYTGLFYWPSDTFNSTNVRSKIYVADYSGPNSSYVGIKKMVDVSTLGINVLNQFPNPGDADNNSWGLAGMIGTAISDDEKYLYVINAGKGNIIKLDISGVNYASLPATAPTAADVTEIAIPTTITNAVNGRFRPTSLRRVGNDLYIGGVNDAANGGTGANLKLIIIKMNMSTQAFSSVFEFVPNFTAGGILNLGLPQVPWTYLFGPSNLAVTNIQPYVSQFDFDDKGNLIIGIGNRQYYQNFINGPQGYVVRASPNTSGGYDLENAGISGVDTSIGGTSNFLGTDGPGTKWFFYQRAVAHAYGFSGAVINVPGEKNMILGYTNPAEHSTNGVRFTNPQNGVQNYYALTLGSKNSMLTGIEAVCDINPIEVGNLVWKDVNNNGIQDGDEPALVGVSVCLYDATNTLVSTAVTDANGNYIFSSAAGTSTGSRKYGLSLTNGADYTLKVCALGSDPSVAGLGLTGVAPAPGETSGQPNSRTTLSNNDAFLVSGNPTISFKMGNPGENNHNYDFGLAIPCTTPVCGSVQIHKN